MLSAGRSLPGPALFRALSRALKRSWPSRLAWVAALLCSAGFLPAIWLAGELETRLSLTNQLVAWLSWTAAPLSAWAGARLGAGVGIPTPLAENLQLAGLAHAESRYVTSWATAVRIATLLGAPLLLASLVTLAGVPSWSALTAALAHLALAASYVVLLALLLTTFTQWSMSWTGSAAYPLVGVVLLPELARQVWPSTPTLLAALQWLLSAASRVAGGLL